MADSRSQEKIEILLARKKYRENFMVFTGNGQFYAKALWQESFRQCLCKWLISEI